MYYLQDEAVNRSVYEGVADTCKEEIKLIPQLQSRVKYAADRVCLTCPMARLTKIPFSLSLSHAEHEFDLLHADIWGPYVHTEYALEVNIDIS